MRSIVRALARGRILRGVSYATLLAMSSCAGQVQLPPATPTQPTVPSTTSTIAGIIGTVADGLQGVESQLGLSSTDLGKLTSLTSQLAGIAQQMSSGAGSGLLSTAEGVINLITPFIPGGTLLTAIKTAIGTAESLSTGRMAATAPGAMTHDQAMSILREASAGRLPR